METELETAVIPAVCHSLKNNLSAPLLKLCSHICTIILCSHSCNLLSSDIKTIGIFFIIKDNFFPGEGNTGL